MLKSPSTNKPTHNEIGHILVVNISILKRMASVLFNGQFNDSYYYATTVKYFMTLLKSICLWL